MLICLIVAWYVYIPSTKGDYYEKIQVTNKGIDWTPPCWKFTKVEDGGALFACGTFYIVQEVDYK
jgi:hypothetical protein